MNTVDALIFIPPLTSATIGSSAAGTTARPSILSSAPCPFIITIEPLWFLDDSPPAAAAGIGDRGVTAAEGDADDVFLLATAAHENGLAGAALVIVVVAVDDGSVDVER